MRRRRAARQSAGLTILLMAALFLLPLLVILPFRLTEEPQELAAEQETTLPPAEPGVQDSAVMLRVLCGETVEEMDLGTYLTGVLRAEMPASFQPEALKAQAVAARTYTLYKLRTGTAHAGDADICTDFNCCQAWKSGQRAAEDWGSDAAAYENKIRNAVADTDGQVMLYQQEPILAVFHSASAGLTRAAGEVWVNDLPYLQPVSSPEDEERIPNYYSRVELPASEFREKFLAVHPEAVLEGDSGSWLRDAVTDDAGSVITVTVGGVTVKGTGIRSLLGLRSACFTWESRGDTLTFYVTGYGHGVGMSQYGADEMARKGADFREILTHYYTGVTVADWPAGLYKTGENVVKSD